MIGRSADDVAGLLARVLRQFCGGELPVRIRAWDGSEAGPAGRPAVILRSNRALRRLLWNPGELGLAQAYVAGELDVDGDLAEGLRLVWQATTEGRLSRPRLAAWPSAMLAAVRLGAIGPLPPAPACQIRVSGRPHTRRRARQVISHHYDLPVGFYGLFLDPSMAYSCAYWRPSGPDRTLADAQRDKLDLVCRRLRLRPGARLLDLGCGWGSLAVHAASRCGASVTAVTLSAQQGRYTRRRVRDLGLGPQVHVRVGDWRDLGGEPYDAIACIEMGEHVGAVAYPEFCARLAGLLRPGGLVVVQQMARRGRPGGGPFIESFIAPDMHMRPVGETVSLLEDAGLEVTEVEGMRQDYHRTIRAWQAAFEHRISEAEALIGSEAVRVWRLYLSGAALAFEQGRMSVHQILASRPGPAPATPAPKTAARPAAVSASAGAHAASARRARART